MTTSIDRTNYNLLADDTGGNTDGTIWNKNQVKIVLLDAIDAMFNGAAEFDFGGAVSFGPYTTTNTGTKDDWDIDTAAGLTVGVLRCNNATALTIDGIKAPVGSRLLLLSSIGAGSVTVRHQNASSAAANRVITADASDLVLSAGIGAALALYDLTTARWRIVASSADSLKLDNAVCDGRLTLTTATPVTTADVTGAATVYWTPYKGNRIAIYDGSAAWNMRTFSEVSQALGTLTNGLPYDVFAYDNAGVVATEMLAWTSTSARATALVFQDGVLVKSGATTRRYLGTFYTTSTTTTEDSKANRFLWNYSNRLSRVLQRFDSAGSWAYTTLTWRQANANALNQVAVVVGYSEVDIFVQLQAEFSNTTLSNYGSVSIGEDSTTSPSASALSQSTCYIVIANGGLGLFATLRKMPTVGYHAYTWLEEASAGGAGTFYGGQFGLQGSILG